MICGNLSEDKKRESIVNNIDANMFVEAGAGAGKTTIIVNRIINQIKKGAVCPEELVVITFTNKAAEELYRRITDDLIKAIKKTEGTEKENLENAFNNIDLMTISTIHSFCKKIIAERVFDAGVPVDMRIIDGDEEGRIEGVFFENWFKNLNDRRLINSGYVCWKDYKQRVEECFKNICGLSDDTEVVYDEEIFDKEIEYFENGLQSVIDKVFDIAENEGVNDKIKSGAKFNDLFYADFVKTESDKNINVRLKSVGKLAAELKIFKKKKGVQEQEECDELNNMFAESSEYKIAKKISEEWEIFKHAVVMAPAVKAANEYKKKRSYSYISNDDLLKIAHKLVTENKDARMYLKNKYKCIYVDEFQDTDHIQADMIWQLALEDGTENKLRKGVLFVTGDPKQSIYRFRGAELNVYTGIKGKMTEMEEAQVYILDNNYRSNEKIVDWVNREFRNRFENMAEVMSYSDMICVNKNISDEGNIISGVYRSDSFDTKNMEAEGEMLSDIIHNIVNNYSIMYKDEEGIRKSRKAEYKDFLLLYWDKKDIDIYYNKLIEKNIPIDFGAKYYIAENKMISRFVMLYDFLADRKNKNKRMGALQIALGDDFTDSKMRNKGEARINALYNATKDFDAYALAEYLTGKTELILPPDTQLSESEIYTLQTRLKQMVETVISSVRGNRQALAENFAEYRNREIEREIPLEEGRNAVRLMNIHQAKGLEGNIVIIIKRNKEIKFKEGSHREGKKYYMSIKYGFNDIYSHPYYESRDIEEKAKIGEADENMRLQYVAATRAREALIFMEELNKKTYFSDFDIKECPVIGGADEEGENENTLYEPLTSVNNEYEFTEEQKKPQYIVLNPSAFEKRESKNVERHEEDIAETEIDMDIEPVDESETVKGAVFGTVMHRCFELIVNEWKENFEISDDEIKSIVNSAVCQAVIEELDKIPADKVSAYKAELNKMAEGFINDCEIINAVKNAEAVYTELPFSFFAEGEETINLMKDLNIEKYTSSKVWVNGIADMVIKNHDGSIIIADYKSDERKDYSREEFKKILNERYKGQLALYKYAVGKVMGAEPGSIKCMICNYR